MPRPNKGGMAYQLFDPETRREVVRLYVDEGMIMREIADHFNNQGDLPTMTKTHVDKILKTERVVTWSRGNYPKTNTGAKSAASQKEDPVSKGIAELLHQAAYLWPKV
jgi:hypothetical protein